MSHLSSSSCFCRRSDAQPRSHPSPGSQILGRGMRCAHGLRKRSSCISRARTPGRGDEAGATLQPHGVRFNRRSNLRHGMTTCRGARGRPTSRRTQKRFIALLAGRAGATSCTGRLRAACVPYAAPLRSRLEKLAQTAADGAACSVGAAARALRLRPQSSGSRTRPLPRPRRCRGMGLRVHD